MHAILLSLTLVAAQDSSEWGGFRGDNASGVSTTGFLPGALDQEQNLLWSTPIPAGYSSPVVAGEHVFVTGAQAKKLVTLCLERDTGEILWRKEVEFDGTRPGANSPAAPTPATDGERVHVLFHHVGMITYDMDGKELWRADLGPFNIPHGMASSPLLCDGVVVQLVDQDTDSFLTALDAATGKKRWRVEREGVVHGYSTPIIHRPAEGPPQVIVSSSFQITAYSLEDGERIWWVNGGAWQTKCVPVIAGDMLIVNSSMSSPTEMGVPRFSGTFEELLAERDADGNGLISRDEWVHEMLHQIWFIADLDGDDMIGPADWDFCLATGRALGGLFGIRLGGEGDVTESHLVWFSEDRRGLPDSSSPLVLNGVLYLLKSGGILTSMDPATGEVIKRGRIGDADQYYASPIGANDLILGASLSGQLTLLRAGAEWEEISACDLGEQVWSTPALAGELLFVRSQLALHCFFAEPE